MDHNELVLTIGLLIVTIIIAMVIIIKRMVAEETERFNSLPTEMEVTKPDLLNYFSDYRCMAYDFVKLSNLLDNPELTKVPCKLVTDTNQIKNKKHLCPVFNKDSFECSLPECANCRFMIQYAKQVISLWLEKNSNFDILQVNVEDIETELAKDIQVINKLISGISDKEVAELNGKVNAMMSSYSHSELSTIIDSLRELTPYSFGHKEHITEEIAKCDKIAKRIKKASLGWWKPMVINVCSRIRAAMTDSDSNGFISQADKDGLLAIPIQYWKADKILQMQIEFEKLPDNGRYIRDVEEITFALFTYYRIVEVLKSSVNPTKEIRQQFYQTLSSNRYLAVSNLRLEFYSRGWID